MARERRRLLIPPERLAQQVALTAPEAHYLGRVLRLGAGQRCDVVDGEGHRWSALLEGADRLRLEQPLEQPLEQHPPRQPALALALALPRQEVELIWRMATELGIDRLQPLQAERSVGRGRWPQERWRTIVREATEQCERLWLPRLQAPETASAWFERPRDGMGPHLLASSRGTDLPHLLQALQTHTSSQPGSHPAAQQPAQQPTQPAPQPPAQQEVWVAIGPEGGWTPSEESLALAQGWIPVSAGSSILRTATAAVAAVAWMAAWRTALSSSSAPGRSP